MDKRLILLSLCVTACTRPIPLPETQALGAYKFSERVEGNATMVTQAFSDGRRIYVQLSEKAKDCKLIGTKVKEEATPLLFSAAHASKISVNCKGKKATIYLE